MKVEPEIRLTPRGGVDGSLADVPMITVAWRARRAELRRQNQNAQAAHRSTEKMKSALIQIAEELFQLRAAACDLKEAEASVARAIHLRADRIEAQLNSAGVDLLAPVGEPYSGELLELIENIAQRPGAGPAPRIHEIVAPAILFDGKIECMGKAVIEIPEATASGREKNSQSSERSADPTDL